MRKFWVVLGIALGVVVAVLAIATVALMVMFPAERIKQMVIPHVEKTLGRTVKVGGAGILVFPRLGVTLKGLEVANTARPGFSSDPFLRLKAFAVSVKVLPLLRKRVEIHRITLDQPRILIEVDTAGAYNFDDLAFMRKGKKLAAAEEKKPSGPLALPVPLTLEKFEIKAGSVLYNDMKARRRVTLGRIDQRVNVSIDRQLKDVVTTGDLVVSAIDVATKEIPRPLTGLALTFSHDVKANVVEGTATVNALRLTLQKLAFQMSGSVTNFNTTPVVDLRLRTDTLLVQDLLAEVPAALVPAIAKITSDGRLYLDLRVAGALAAKTKPEIAGTLVVRNLMVKHADFPKSLNSGAIDVTFGANDLDVRQFTVKLGDNPIGLRATVHDFAEPSIKGSLRAVFSLDEVKDLVKLPDGVTLGGKIDVDVRAEGKVDPEDPTRMAVEGKVRLDKVLVTTPQLARPLSANGAVEFSPKAVNARLSAAVGGSSLDLNAKVSSYLALVLPVAKRKGTRPEVEFRLKSPNLDLDEMLPKKERPAEQQPKDQAPETAADAATLILAKPLPGIDVRGEIACARLTNEGTQFADLRSEIHHRNDVGDVNVKGRLYGGSVNADVHLDVRDHRSIGYALKADIDRVQMNDFVSAFNDRLTPTTTLMRALRDTDSTLYGLLTVRAKFSGKGGTKAEIQRSLRGTVTLSATDGRIAPTSLVRSFSKALEKIHTFNDIPFDQLRGEFRIENERLYVDTLRVVCSLGDIGAKGSVGTDGTYDVLVSDRLTRPISDKLVALQNTGKQALGGLIEGTALESIGGKVLDKAGVPVDNDGRVTVNFRVLGTTSNPRVVPAGFGGKGGSTAATPREAAREAAREAGKQALEQAVEEAKKKVPESVKEEARKLEQQLPPDAKKKINKVLKGLKL